MDRDSSALQPVSIPLATNDFCCCTTTNGLCPPLPSYLPPLPFSLLSVLSISYYSIPRYLATSTFCLYLIFISLCLYLSLSLSPLFYVLVFFSVFILTRTKNPRKSSLSSLSALSLLHCADRKWKKINMLFLSSCFCLSL